MNSNKNNSNENFQIKGNWEAQSRQLKSNYPQLTDQDLKYEKGKEDELLERVENRLNKDRETVIGIINENQNEQQREYHNENQNGIYNEDQNEDSSR
ncbi:hypothetical protein [Marivirga sp.]|uniref:hypothetical protein n=1 Tax=Marivirga sp. TaxID=2018662 RepID=UPI002D7EFD68|nr:hypothetical protein [Marivirga sp.]HET8860898.1 hypothetical protein [Marivirga sp.]